VSESLSNGLDAKVFPDEDDADNRVVRNVARGECKGGALARQRPALLLNALVATGTRPGATG
jgi:hypothetical protein